MTSINKLYFKRPLLNEEGAIMHDDALQISIDDDVVEMIHCKSLLLIKTIIELFVMFTS